MSQADFERAADEVTRLQVRPGYGELAEVYGLYKQATVGDVNIQRPGMFDIPGKAKWDAWKTKEGMAKEEAVEAYIAVVEELKAKYGL